MPGKSPENELLATASVQGGARTDPGGEEGMGCGVRCGVRGAGCGVRPSPSGATHCFAPARAGKEGRGGKCLKEMPKHQLKERYKISMTIW